MPPEHDEVRARQIAALERYVAELGVPQEGRAKEVAKPRPEPERRRRPPLSWLALTALLVALGVIGGVAVGALVWSDDRAAGAQENGAATQSPNTTTATTATQGPETTTAAPVASPACKTAVDRANAMLANVVQLQRALAEHGKVLADPLNRKRSGSKVLDRSAPSLKAGADESAKLSQALAGYRQIVDQCKLQTP